MFDFSKVLSNYPNQYKEEFKKFLTFRNCKWAYLSLHVILTLACFMFMLAMMIDDAVQIKIANGLFVVFIFIELFIIRLTVPENVDEVEPLYDYLIDMVLLTCLFWGATIAGYTMDSTVATLNLTLVIVFVPTVFMVYWQKTIVLYTLTLIYLTFFTPYVFSGGALYPPKLFSILFLMAFGWFISRLMYASTVDNFVTTKALEKQKSRLRDTVIRKTHEFKSLEEVRSRDVIVALSKVLEFYDLYTKGHSENVATLSQKIAKEMGLSDEIISNLYWCGMVHDIGKIQVRRDVLNKREALTDDEFEMIKMHPTYGFEMLKESEGLKPVAEIILHHHERWDGRGYPDGKMGNDIPVEALILSVADSWDAMASRRVYRDPLSYQDAVTELKRCSGTQFAPKVVEAFLKLLESEHFLYE